MLLMRAPFGTSRGPLAGRFARPPFRDVPKGAGVRASLSLVPVIST